MSPRRASCPGWDCGISAGFTRFAPAWSTPDRQPNLFAAGRDIGDEYRYILERRYSKIFPGNMLTRPGLLLNPWEVRSTDLQAQLMAAMAQAPGDARQRGEAQRQAAAAREPTVASRNRGPTARKRPISTSSPQPRRRSSICRRMSRASCISTARRSAIASTCRSMRRISPAPSGAPSRWATLPTKFQDLRLTRNLDPAKAFTEKKDGHRAHHRARRSRWRIS